MFSTVAAPTYIGSDFSYGNKKMLFVLFRTERKNIPKQN